MTVLVLAEHEQDALVPATLSAVTAARALGGDVVMLVLSAPGSNAAQAAAAVPGVAKVLHAEAPWFAQPTAENVAATAQAAIERGDYGHVVAAATSFGKN